MRLSDFAADVHSQFGQDGMIAHILGEIGVGHRTCVEFGAYDGVRFSNTAALYKDGWRSLMIEADVERFAQLQANVTGHDVTAVHCTVDARGPNSLDAILDAASFDAIDFMTIDIDGNDYWVWQHMRAAPRALTIEFNFTVPSHISVKQPDSSAVRFGASAAALVELGHRKGYTFVGLAHSDLFFVRDDLAGPFLGYERDLGTLLPDEQFCYLVSDYDGNVGSVGSPPPFGLRHQLFGIDDVVEVVRQPLRLAEAVERRFNCPVLYLTPENWHNVDFHGEGALAPGDLDRYLRAGLPAVVLSIAHVSDPRGLRWLHELAASHGYVVFHIADALAVVSGDLLTSVAA